MNASATLVFSQGHHPANHRSAIPTRVYESGSGHGHDAAPAGHPHPPRPPPEPGHPGSRALAAHHRLPAARVKAACGVASGERSAHLDPGHRSHDPWQLSRTRDQTGTPTFPAQPHDTTPQTTTNQAQNLQSLDVPLHMSALMCMPALRRPPARVSASPTSHSRHPTGPRCGRSSSRRPAPEPRSCMNPGCDLSTMPAITACSCVTPMVTTSRPCAARPSARQVRASADVATRIRGQTSLSKRGFRPCFGWVPGRSLVSWPGGRPAGARPGSCWPAGSSAPGNPCC